MRLCRSALAAVAAIRLGLAKIHAPGPFVPAGEAAIHTVRIAGIRRTGGGKLIVPPWCVHAGDLLTAGAAVLLGRAIVWPSSPLVACDKGATYAVALRNHRCTIGVKLV